MRNCYSQFKCNYLKNAKHFLDFLLHLSNLQQIWNISKSKMMVIANVLPKLQTVKNFVRPLCKKAPFRNTLWESTCENVPNTCKFSMRAFFSCFSSFLGKLIRKTSPLVLAKILSMFVNTYTADWENLQLLIQMQLSEKRKRFSEFLVPFLESTSNFEHFEKKDDDHS